MIEVPGAVLGVLAKHGLEYFSSLIKSTGLKTRNAKDALQRHLEWVSFWSNDSQTISIPHVTGTSKKTVALNLSTQPRRFRTQTADSDVQINENDVLNDERNRIILGDPGSGKTTTIKRIVLELFASKKDRRGRGFFPLVVEARSAERGETFYEVVCRILDLEYVPNENLDPDGDLAEKMRRFRGFVQNFVAKTRVLLIVDGLDEVDENVRSDWERDIGELASMTSKSFILITCRSGDYTYRISGFELIEIMPLNCEQQEGIARTWFSENEGEIDKDEEKQRCDFEIDSFFNALSNTVYSDLADRPVFFIYILIIFRSTNSLPTQSVDVIRRVIDIIVRSWDLERGVLRISKYSEFDIDRKVDFLSAIAYEITFRRQVQRFSSSDLSAIYRSLASRFNLPDNEVTQVVAEVESHNGLIVYSSFDMYEFSHLTIQEFLAASYLSKVPFGRRTVHHLVANPGCVGLACCVSPEPSAWLAELLAFVEPLIRTGEVTSRTVSSLVHRVLLEKPFIEPSGDLGVAVLRTLAALHRPGGANRSNDFHLDATLLDFLNLDALSISMGLGFLPYHLKSAKRGRTPHDKFVFELTDPRNSESHIFARELSVDWAVIERLCKINSAPIKVSVRSTTGVTSKVQLRELLSLGRS